MIFAGRDIGSNKIITQCQEPSYSNYTGISKATQITNSKSNNIANPTTSIIIKLSKTICILYSSTTSVSLSSIIYQD